MSAHWGIYVLVTIHSISNRDSSQVTAFIMRSFWEEAIKRGSLPLLIIIPTAMDMMSHEASGVWSYQSLLSYLEDDVGANVVYPCRG